MINSVWKGSRKLYYNKLNFLSTNKTELNEFRFSFLFFFNIWSTKYSIYFLFKLIDLSFLFYYTMRLLFVYECEGVQSNSFFLCFFSSVQKVKNQLFSLDLSFFPFLFIIIHFILFKLKADLQWSVRSKRFCDLLFFSEQWIKYCRADSVRPK